MSTFKQSIFILGEIKLDFIFIFFFWKCEKYEYMYKYCCHC